MAKKVKSAVKFFLGKSFMRDGFIRVTVYPKRPEVTSKVFEALKQVGYVESDRETWTRLRGNAQKELNNIMM